GGPERARLGAVDARDKVFATWPAYSVGRGDLPAPGEALRTGRTRRAAAAAGRADRSHPVPKHLRPKQRRGLCGAAAPFPGLGRGAPGPRGADRAGDPLRGAGPEEGAAPEGPSAADLSATG